MLRLSVFVDGPNLVGSLKKLNANVEVEKYESFYRYIIEESLAVWNRCTINGNFPIALQRVYWYCVGSIDKFNFKDPKSLNYLNEQFHANKDLKSMYMAQAGKDNPQKTPKETAEIAYNIFLKKSSEWYATRAKLVDGFHGFYNHVRSESDFIEIIPCGHWKLNLLTQQVEEKGVDTKLSVDIVTMTQNYDIALIMSGDADTIPSVDYIKNMGKHVGVVEFIKGSPPESKGKQSSRRLSAVADFVVKIYETDLTKHKLVGPLSDK